MITIQEFFSIEINLLSIMKKSIKIKYFLKIIFYFKVNDQS